ncbi:MAG: class 1 fructose-bisphosphatase [Pseudodesulfovibrio sp.]|jgi:fructose-1,6-bisphosphatase I|uniref:Fructose-1,6-bisphosphatase class 1 n=1 Tax=Pseudodesulfovibrio indicus TaxID=1716143 RepID=A0A126QPV2_9BACT|nr:class 1 fructose-bisphosphatase [Pseudodesulfovibrio indicus]AMK11981.1 fructose-bisphosphatase [Pseudodesulfovibrio indicus]TDT87256.1 fructose-1,6-bisphosphatase I [Pseudodesulfovibrio indicus]
MSQQVTVTEHILLHQKMVPGATGQFTRLFNELVLSAKIITRAVNKAGLVDILGFTGDVNVQGEEVKKLDEYANRILIHRLARSGVLCAMASEENADIIEVPESLPRGEYIIIFDPLDGSSNIDVNVNIGTIFSIFKRKSDPDAALMSSDVLQKGSEQVAAGYVLYGSSTMLVFTCGDGVHGFTLDPSVGEFLLSHPNIRIPEQGKIYSVNEGYERYWDRHTKKALAYFKSPKNALRKPYSGRYIGSLVADFHRNLLYGGIFMYPADLRDPKKPTGKLRLTCECNPMAFIVEQAGGMAVDGLNRVMDIEPDHLHQRIPFFCGSRNDVQIVQEIYESETRRKKGR